MHNILKHSYIQTRTNTTRRSKKKKTQNVKVKNRRASGVKGMKQRKNSGLYISCYVRSVMGDTASN